MSSWNVAFITKWAKYISIKSVFILRNYFINADKNNLKNDEKLIIEVINPFRARIFLRKKSSDIGNFQEIVNEDIYSEVLSYCSDCKSVIDLGANIGLSTLYFAAAFPKSRILCVEPDPENFQVLSANLSQLVTEGRCSLLNAAVWSEDNKLQVDQDEDKSNHWGIKVKKVDSHTNNEPIINGYTMTNILEKSGFDKVDILKIDIEGSEIELFKNDTDWLNKIKYIAIEFHDNTREISNFDHIMSEYNFTVNKSTGHTVLAYKK